MKQLHVVSQVVWAYLKKLMKATVLIQGNVFFSLFQMNHEYHRRQLKHVNVVDYVISKWKA
jgi:hypothetical protein